MIKSTGIVRKIDELGRIVLPVEIRNTMDIKAKDPVEIFVEDSNIILKKYEPACLFCGNAAGVTHFSGKLLCADCIQKIKNLL